MGIRIGNNNKINKTTIADKSSIKDGAETKKRFVEKHPVITAVIVSFVVGFVLLFSFWQKIVDWIEGLL